MNWSPFGMMMPGRKYEAGNRYRYGFNGKEKDSEISGLGNELDFGARIYNPRLGKWLSVDLLQSKYPGLSSYNFANNSPISAYDPDGRLIIFINGWPGFGACCPGTQAYWGGWDKKAMDRIMDHNSMYVDGSSKHLLSLPSTRYDNGYNLGKSHAADVIANLKKDANGDIVESVKIITSSQGAATERGFSQALTTT